MVEASGRIPSLKSSNGLAADAKGLASASGTRRASSMAAANLPSRREARPETLATRSAVTSRSPAGARGGGGEGIDRAMGPGAVAGSGEQGPAEQRHPGQHEGGDEQPADASQAQGSDSTCRRDQFQHRTRVFDDPGAAGDEIGRAHV